MEKWAEPAGRPAVGSYPTACDNHYKFILEVNAILLLRITLSRIMYVDFGHKYVYSGIMKRRELEQRMEQAGWWFLKHGGKHDIWTNGTNREYVPRHSEINEKLARAILRKIGVKSCG